jgi:hypothetical protein
VVMDLITKDGMVLINKEEYGAIHDLSKMMPDLIQSVAIASHRCDEKIEALKKEKDCFCKLRRILTEVQGKISLLLPKKEGIK